MILFRGNPTSLFEDKVEIRRGVITNSGRDRGNFHLRIVRKQFFCFIDTKGSEHLGIGESICFFKELTEIGGCERKVISDRLKRK